MIGICVSKFSVPIIKGMCQNHMIQNGQSSSGHLNAGETEKSVAAQELYSEEVVIYAEDLKDFLRAPGVSPQWRAEREGADVSEGWQQQQNGIGVVTARSKGQQA